jgi:hypothetical protein
MEMNPDLQLTKIALASLMKFKECNPDLLNEFDEIRWWVNNNIYDLASAVKCLEQGKRTSYDFDFVRKSLDECAGYRAEGVYYMVAELADQLACDHDWKLASTGGLRFNGEPDDDIKVFEVCIKCGAILPE